MKRGGVDLEDWFNRAVDWYASVHGLNRKQAESICGAALERSECFRGLDAAAEMERGHRKKLVGHDAKRGAFVQPGST